MGSSTEVVTDIDSVKLVPDNYRLYQKTVVNTTLNLGEIDIEFIFHNLLKGTQILYNKNILEKRNLLINVPINILELDEEKILLYLIENVDSDAQEVLSYGYQDEDGNIVNQDLLFIIDTLEANQTYSLSDYIEYTVSVVYDNTIYEKTFQIGSIEIDDNKYVPKIDNDGNFNITGIDNEYQIELININDDNDTLFYDIGENLSETYYVIYSNSTENNIAISYKSNFLTQKEYGQSLFIPLKFLGNAIAEQYEFILNKFGIKKELDNPDSSISEAYNNDKIYNMFLTYMLPVNEDMLKDYRELIYGTIDNPKEVYFIVKNDMTDNYLRIYYSKYNRDNLFLLFEEYDNNNNYISSLGLKYYYEFEDKPFFIISIDPLVKSSLRFKYDFYEKTFSILLSLREEVEVSFWQTFFGQFILVLAGAALAFFTGGTSLALTTLAVGTTALIASQISPELGQIVSLVGIFLAPNVSITQALTNPTNVLQIANVLIHNISENNIEDKLNQIKNIDNKTKEAIEEYQKNKGLDIWYNPYDETHKLNDIVTNPLDATWNSVKLGFDIKPELYEL